MTMLSSCFRILGRQCSTLAAIPAATPKWIIVFPEETFVTTLPSDCEDPSLHNRPKKLMPPTTRKYPKFKSTRYTHGKTTRAWGNKLAKPRPPPDHVRF
eukprot:NODE_7712_length_417_cov_13.113793_g7546_i0.p1 GENE.NODE_7712_length_417_cov_13.113793_g7546_i0~~NODE_7712_length_417_cov_13.113793_g7546_i0.p1  ORF type:complete len:116 (-),score=27.61 NODE_7712_length_417_cov_13.113793_g7546_i0:69-365(-)